MLHYVPDCDLAWVEIKKNASGSILRVLLDRAAPLEKSNPCERVAMWRDPRERMQSAYRMFAMIEPFVSLEGRDFSAFVIDVCAGFKKGDPHVAPQYSFLDGPTRIIRWDFDAFGKLFNCVIPHKNKSAPAPVQWSDAARRRFADVYAKDIEIWENKDATRI